MQGLILTALTGTEKLITNYLIVLKLCQLMQLELQFKVTRSLWVLEEYVKDNNYARFHTHSYHRCRQTH